MIKVKVFGVLGACPIDKMEKQFRGKDHFTQSETIKKALERKYGGQVEVEYIDQNIHGFIGHPEAEELAAECGDDLPMVCVDGKIVSRGGRIDYKAVTAAIDEQLG